MLFTDALHGNSANGSGKECGFYTTSGYDRNPHENVQELWNNELTVLVEMCGSSHLEYEI